MAQLSFALPNRRSKRNRAYMGEQRVSHSDLSAPLVPVPKRHGARKLNIDPIPIALKL
jgi:hypothetical protein